METKYTESEKTKIKELYKACSMDEIRNKIFNITLDRYPEWVDPSVFTMELAHEGVERSLISGRIRNMNGAVVFRERPEGLEYVDVPSQYTLRNVKYQYRYNPKWSVTTIDSDGLKIYTEKGVEKREW